jgi:hypothetical protein
MRHAQQHIVSPAGIIPGRIESDSPPKQAKREASSAFLKKSTKKLLFASVRTDRIRRANQWSESFLVLFSKKHCLLAAPFSVGFRQRFDQSPKENCFLTSA